MINAVSFYFLTLMFSFEDAAPYGPAASAFYNRRLHYLRPDKLALALGDPMLEVRKNNALQLGIQPVIARGVWREYLTTKLLAHINK